MPKFVRISLAVAALAGVGATATACASVEESATAKTDTPMITDYEPGSAKSKPAPRAHKSAPVDPDIAKAARVVRLTEKQGTSLERIVKITSTVDDSNMGAMCADARVVNRELDRVEQRQRVIKRVVRSMDNPPTKGLDALGDVNSSISGMRDAADTLEAICA